MKFMIFFNHMEGVWGRRTYGTARASNHEQALGKLITTSRPRRKPNSFSSRHPETREQCVNIRMQKRSLTGGLRTCPSNGTRTTRWVLPDRSGFDG